MGIILGGVQGRELEATAALAHIGGTHDGGDGEGAVILAAGLGAAWLLIAWTEHGGGKGTGMSELPFRQLSARLPQSAQLWHMHANHTLTGELAVGGLVRHGAIGILLVHAHPQVGGL